MKVLSLFNGISCGRIALERAEIAVERYVSYEIDKYANKVAKLNYPHDEYYGDVFDADFTQYKGFDLLIGGSPCTHWSIAKQGRETTSSGIGWELFMQYKRALVESGCQYFLYENNYSIHKDIQVTISEELGVHPIMINSALLSAQQRKRFYWTNISDIEQPQDKGILLQHILESGISDRNKAHAVTATYYKMGNKLNSSFGCEEHRQKIFEPVRIGNIGSDAQAHRVYSVQGKSVCLSANGRGQGAKTGLYKIDLPNGDYIIRKLTPIECERLQTLPDNYTAGISNTQRYKCLGNGWTVDVIAHIFSYLKLINKAGV